MKLFIMSWAIAFLCTVSATPSKACALAPKWSFTLPEHVSSFLAPHFMTGTIHHPEHQEQPRAGHMTTVNFSMTFLEKSMEKVHKVLQLPLSFHYIPAIVKNEKTLSPAKEFLIYAHKGIDTKLYLQDNKSFVLSQFISTNPMLQSLTLLFNGSHDFTTALKENKLPQNFTLFWDTLQSHIFDFSATHTRPFFKPDTREATPTPEPATFLLTGIGIASLASVGFRRKT